MNWDVFISHASEDKASVVRPLAGKLSERGLRVWMDEDELLVGDSVRAGIDRGLATSAWAIVILSKSFFAKGWPMRELDSLVALEAAERTRILPIWHGLTSSDVAKHSPLLAAKMGVETSRGLDFVCDAVCNAMDRHRDEQRSPSLSAADHKPSTVGDYALKAELGRGGTGTVYKGIHLPTLKTVAVKVFDPLPCDLADFARATARSVRGLASIDHPNVVKIIDFGVAQRVPQVVFYLVTELLNGSTLDDWTCGLQDVECSPHRFAQTLLTGQRPPPEVMLARFEVAIRVADALATAHACQFTGDLGFSETGVFHGDIKPSNILVADGNRPVVIDFMMPDIHRLLATQSERAQYSHWEKGADSRYTYRAPLTGVYGTPGFMAPEQEVDGVVTPVSDVYSLGATLLRLFWPCDDPGLSHAAADYAAKGDDPALQALGRLIRAMTLPQPEDRPSSMREVWKALCDGKERI